MFLSYTSELRRYPRRRKSFVSEAYRAIVRSGNVPDDMSDQSANHRPPVEVCQARIAKSDVFVLVAGFRYGSLIPDETVSYTEFEFDEAGRQGKKRIAILLGTRTEGPSPLFLDPENSRRQLAFRDKVKKSGLVVSTVTNPDQVHASVLTTLNDIADSTDAPPRRYERNTEQTSPPTGPPHVVVPSSRPRSSAAVAVPLAILSALALGAAIVNVPDTAPRPAADPCAPVAGESATPRGDQNDRTLALGAVVPLTGPLEYRGRPLRAGTDLALRDISAAGGIPGVPTVTMATANEGQPGSSEGCAAAGTLLASGADIILGPSSSASSLRMTPRVGGAGGMLISPASTAPELSSMDDRGVFFRTAPTDLMQGRILADLVATSRADNTVIVTRGDAYGRGLSAEVARELRGFEGRRVRTVEFKPSEDPQQRTDFGRAIADIVANPTDAIVMIGFEEIGTLLQDMDTAKIDRGPGGKKVYATDGFLRDYYPANLGGGGLVAGVQGTRPKVDREFVKRLVNEVDPELKDFSFAPAAYDAVVVTALAAAAAGSGAPGAVRPKINDVTRGQNGECLTFAQCRDQLVKNPKADINYRGVSGPLDFTGDGEPCQGHYSFEQYNASGQLAETGRYYGTYLCTGPL